MGLLFGNCIHPDHLYLFFAIQLFLSVLLFLILHVGIYMYVYIYSCAETFLLLNVESTECMKCKKSSSLKFLFWFHSFSSSSSSSQQATTIFYFISIHHITRYYWSEMMRNTKNRMMKLFCIKSHKAQRIVIFSMLRVETKQKSFFLVP
jgi:hypothetical protein